MPAHLPETSLPALDHLQRCLGYTFREPALLLRALTHPSYLQDHPEARPGNQRLEFLGDSVLQLALSEALFQLFPEEREGPLSQRRSALAKGRFLSLLAGELTLDTALRLGQSEEQTGGRQRASILEDALEAVVGAIYLDSDFATARRAVLGWYGPLPDRLAALLGEDNPKGRLQELLQPVHGNRALRYETVHTEGAPHEREYEVNVYLNDTLLGAGRGNSKKLAEEAAARAALPALQPDSARQ
ncbi:MAG TPA: ribonuclease III [Opitutaceae bacterium]|nr:ribonuclease III [Opitutaceae bacterium]